MPCLWRTPDSGGADCAVDRLPESGVRHRHGIHRSKIPRMATLSVPSISGEGNLSRYLQEIRKFPMLEPEEEYMLAKRWKEEQDSDAAHRLVPSHLRLVAK